MAGWKWLGSDSFESTFEPQVALSIMSHDSVPQRGLVIAARDQGYLQLISGHTKKSISTGGTPLVTQRPWSPIPCSVSMTCIETEGLLQAL